MQDEPDARLSRFRLCYRWPPSPFLPFCRRCWPPKIPEQPRISPDWLAFESEDDRPSRRPKAPMFYKPSLWIVHPRKSACGGTQPRLFLRLRR